MDTRVDDRLYGYVSIVVDENRFMRRIKPFGRQPNI